MKVEKNTYTNGELTVAYEPKKCIHAGECCKGLSEVFRNSVIPWIDLEGAENERIISQISQCPSGALTFERKEKMVLAQ